MKTFLPHLLMVLFSLNPFISLSANHANYIGRESSPITFLANQGQWQKEILYQGVSTLTNIYFLKNGLSFGMPGKSIKNSDGTKTYPYIIWNLEFINSSKDVYILGSNKKESVYSYLYGKDPSKWVIRPPEYTEIFYKEIYKNIDLKYYGIGYNLKYDFIIKPGGDIGSINASYAGIKSLRINSSNELEVENLYDTQIQRAPVAWQIINGEKQYVDVQYKILNDSTFGFTAKGYNRDYELIIDPLFQMVWASYTKALGISNNINYCFSNAMDNQGNVYLTGMVDGTYPITPGAYSGPGSIVPEIFVSKFSSDGSTLLYSTYISGSSLEYGQGIAVDALGRAHITGFAWTNFTGGNTYPTTPNAFQPNIVANSGEDAIYTVLNPTGTGLEYSTFLGGSNAEQGIDIKIGIDGMAYITGSTGSTDFPIKNSSITQTGQSSAFISKFDISQSGANSLIYSAKIGATGNTLARSIDVDNNGNAYITGYYQNFGTNPIFPTTPGAFNSTYTPGSDNGMIFVSKISGTIPVTLDYSTLISSGQGNAIDVDPLNGEAYIAGSTGTYAFPTTPGVIQPVHGQDALGNGNTDAFVVKLNSTGTGLTYSTFIGGERYDYGFGIVVNSVGEVYVTGTAENTFPTSPGAFQESHGNPSGKDFFIVHLNADASAYGCGGSTYVGGNDSDYNSAMNPEIPSPIVTLRDYGGVNDTIAVSGTSHSTNFPTTPGSYEPNKLNGIADQPVFFKMSSICTLNPIAAFNNTITTSCAFANVDFTDATLNNPTSWIWVFTGATPSSSTAQNPQGINYTSAGNYDVTLITCNQYGCDTVTSTIEITLGQNITFNLGNDTTICFGNSINLNAPIGFSNYNWQLNGNNIGNSVSINATQQGIYVVSISDTLGCTGSDTLELEISNPTINIDPDVNICNGDSILINADLGFSQYQWFLNGNNIPENNNSFYASQQGNYVVIATNNVGCNAYDSISINVSSPLADLGPDRVICGNDSVFISAPSGFNSYQWMYNGNIIPVNVNSLYAYEPGSYSVMVQDSSGCTDTDEIIVTETDVPESAFNYTINFNCNGVELRTENLSSNATSYQWILNNGQVHTDTELVLYFESIQGLIIQLVALNGDCSDTVSVENIFFEVPQFDNIPNVITPNGDGINDCFKINGVELLAECTSLNIFNRWGNLVYSVDKLSNCWDGRNENNAELTPGVYFYVLKINDQTYNGAVHLIR